MEIIFTDKDRQWSAKMSVKTLFGLIYFGQAAPPITPRQFERAINNERSFGKGNAYILRDLVGGTMDLWMEPDPSGRDAAPGRATGEA